MIKYLNLYSILFGFFFSQNLFSESLIMNNETRSFKKYFYIRDTLYTLSNYIIEVYLPAQKIYVHSRDGKVLEFKCSTGNPRLEKGVSTPEGIFVIQNKARKIYSAQFDSTLMINWMGFNFNIGFHALQGNAYYKHLGRQVSSHGCIRISRETSEFFYSNIPIGTPVFIHSGKSARVIAFAQKNESYKIENKKSLKAKCEENLKLIYAGLYQLKHHKLIISEKNLSHFGIELGDENKIPPQLPDFLKSQPYHLRRNLFDVKEK